MTTELKAPATEPTAVQAAMRARADLVKVESALTEFDAVEANIAELKTKYTNIVFQNLETTAGMKIARAQLAEVREPRINVEKFRKAGKEPLLTIGRNLDARAKEITAALEELECPMQDQIHAEEERKESLKRAAAEAERRRVEAIHQAINAIRDHVTVASGMSGAEITALADRVEAMQPAEATFGEFLVNAQLAVAETAKALRKAATDALQREEEDRQREADRRELEELRALQARKEAEDAARIKREEEERAARIAAEDKARRETQEREEAEARARRTEDDRQAAAARAAEDKRIADARAALALEEAAAAQRRQQEQAAEEARRQAAEAAARREREAEQARERAAEEARHAADKRLRDAAPALLAALKALFALHEPQGRFQPSHFKPVLAQVREALVLAEEDADQGIAARHAEVTQKEQEIAA
jgi:hypothetical protein